MYVVNTSVEGDMKAPVQFHDDWLLVTKNEQRRHCTPQNCNYVPNEF